MLSPMTQLGRIDGLLGGARKVLLELGAGGRVYVVGGTLRDLLLGREPSDFDFAVAGSGVDFARHFGRKMRGKLVLLSEADDEARVVASGRTYDFNGFGAGSIGDDLARRDFTVNALAAEIGAGGPGELLDPAGGQADIAARVIRPVSARSLALDPLRLLRAFRIALELGFEIDPAVFEQGRQVTFERTAAERIGAEMLRIMEQPGSHAAIVKLWELGRLEEILPALRGILADSRLRKHTFGTYYKIEELVHGASFFSRFEPEWRQYFERWAVENPDEPGLPYRRAMLKLAGLLHDVAKPDTMFENSDGEVHFYGHDTLGARVAAAMLRDRLRLSRHQVKMVKAQVQEHMRLHLLATNPDLTDKAVRRFFRDLEGEAFGLMMLCFADGWATAGRTGHLEDTITRMIEQKRAEDAKLRVKRHITGHDLIALGLRPGPAFKVILQELEDRQLEGVVNSHEEGLEYLRLNLPGLEKMAAEKKPATEQD